MADTEHGIRRTVLRLVLGAVCMVAAIPVVLVPLYNAFCDVTGLNGKTRGEAYVADTGPTVDTSRSVKVKFVAINSEGMRWAFRPNDRAVTVHPGEATATTFFADNPTARDMVAQAIPSIVPAKAAPYFHKTECFCFNQQPLAAGASADMPLQFIVDPELPDYIESITLTYTLFDVTEAAEGTPVAQQN